MYIDKNFICAAAFHMQGFLFVFAMTQTLEHTLKVTSSAERANASRLDENVGFFWDPEVLKNKSNVVSACKTHHALLMASITGGFGKATRQEFSDAVESFNKLNEGKLAVASMNLVEWLRQEGHACKQLMIHIRETEYSSIDFSRQPAHMQSLCKAYRECVRKLESERGSSSKKLKATINEIDKLAPVRALYEQMGLTPPTSKKSKGSELIVLDDSPVLVDSPEPASSSERFYMDYANMKPMCLFPSGAVQAGALKVGPDGFAKGFWPDGKEWNSEVPNMDVQPSKPVQRLVMKRPASRSLWEVIDKDETEAEEEEEELGQAEEEAKEQKEDDQDEEAQAEDESEEDLEDEQPLPTVFLGYQGKLKVTYATAQSYMHIQYQDGVKKFLFGISEGKTSNHQIAVYRIAKELVLCSDNFHNYDWMKAKALELRRERWGY